MDIYGDGFLFFSAPYGAKWLLDDSLERTERGNSALCTNDGVAGFGNILLARVESAAAFALLAVSATMMALMGAMATCCMLIPAMILNLISRIPGISSFNCVQQFTHESSSVIYRALRVYMLAIPVIFLFLAASGINTFLPGMLKSHNLFTHSIHVWVAPLGPLKTIRAIVPGAGEYTGTPTEISIIEGVEEYFRSLSSHNYLSELTVSSLTYHSYS